MHRCPDGSDEPDSLERSHDFVVTGDSSLAREDVGVFFDESHAQPLHEGEIRGGHARGAVTDDDDVINLFARFFPLAALVVWFLTDRAMVQTPLHGR